ncbi:MAG: TonB-dependent receptor [Pseudomonadota bacterium]
MYGKMLSGPSGQQLSGRCGRRVFFEALLTLVFSLACCLANAAKPDFNREIDFLIAQQTADRSLIEFAKQAGITLVFPFDEASQVTTNRLEGRFTLTVGLGKLLQGTSLAPSIDSGQLSVLSAKEEAPDTVKRSFFGRLLSTLALGFAASDASIAQERAQEGAQGSRAVAEERVIPVIVVTAQKREQAIQDVPISITVIDSDFIDKSNLDNIEEYALYAPSVSTDESARANSDIRIRGLGALGGNQNTFGIYLDGFELTGGTSLATTTRLIDVERLEVLRGPQGTAFGRNVVAGAVNITSARPATESLHGLVELGAENFGGYDFRGFLNAPLTDNTALRLSAFYDHTDGNIENVGPAGGRNDMDESGARLSILTRPNERLMVHGAISYERRKAGLTNSVTDGILRGDIAAITPVLVALGLFPEDAFPADPGVFFPDQNDTISLDTPSFTEIENVIATANVEYDLDFASLVWVNGYIKNTFSSQVDLDNSPYNLGLSDEGLKNEFYSTELRLQSNGNGRLDWVTGIYASREEGEIDAGALLFGAAAPQFGINVPFGTVIDGAAVDSSQDGAAAFIDLDYAVNDYLNVLAGIRYNYDEISVVRTQRESFGVLAPDTTGETDDSAVTWRLGLTYALSENINTYGTISTGYRTGGVQLANVASDSFDSENITSYELGIKAFLFDRRGSVSLAAYHMEWEDVQIAVRNEALLVGFTDNAGGADVWGAELDGQFYISDGLSLIFGVGYNDTELNDISGSGDDPREGSPLPLAPEWTASLTVDYQRPVYRDIEGFIRASYIYKGEMFDDLLTPDEESLFYPSYDRFDVRAGVAGASGWRVEAYVENVRDDIYVTGQDVNGISLTGSSIVSPPRRYGIRFTKSFGAD